MSPKKADRVFTSGEVAKVCGVSADTVSRWFDLGQIEGYRLAACRFLESPSFHPFSSRAFLDIFRRLVREDAGVDV